MKRTLKIIVAICISFALVVFCGCQRELPVGDSGDDYIDVPDEGVPPSDGDGLDDEDDQPTTPSDEFPQQPSDDDGSGSVQPPSEDGASDGQGDNGGDGSDGQEEEGGSTPPDTSPEVPPENPPPDEDVEDDEDASPSFSAECNLSQFAGDEIACGTALVEGYVWVNDINGGSSAVGLRDVECGQYSRCALIQNGAAITLSVPVGATLTIHARNLYMLESCLSLSGNDYMQSFALSAGSNDGGATDDYLVFTAELSAGEYTLHASQGSVGIFYVGLFTSQD